MMKVILNTHMGMIPYIVDKPDFLKKYPTLLFLDDFIYDQSYFLDKINKAQLPDFFNNLHNYYLGIRNSTLVGKKYPFTLVSKKGRFRLSKETLEEIKKVTNSSQILLEGKEIIKDDDNKTDNHNRTGDNNRTDNNNKKNTDNDIKIDKDLRDNFVYKEPSTIEELNDFIRNDNIVIGTRFINECVEMGRILYRGEDDELIYKHICDTDYEYEKYLYSIKEINAYIFIAEKNYETLIKYIEEYEH